MAYTFLVLVSRESIPPVEALGPILRKARLPLQLREPWSWKKDSGWLPMTWRKASAGCEVELVKLSRKDAAAATKAGHPGFDAAVAITTRGWESLQAGVCFGAALAVASSGCISEDGDTYVSGDAAMRWARKSVAEADRQARLANEAEAARAQAQGAGSIEDRMEAALAGMAGARVKQFLFMMGQLGVVLDDGRRISGSAWRITAMDGTRHAQDRYSTIRSRQARLMAGPGGAKAASEIASLETQLEQAQVLDEQGARGAAGEMATWPAGAVIRSIAWKRPNVIVIAFDAGMAIEFSGGIFGEVSFSAPPLRYALSDEGARLA